MHKVNGRWRRIKIWIPKIRYNGEAARDPDGLRHPSGFVDEQILTPDGGVGAGQAYRIKRHSSTPQWVRDRRRNRPEQALLCRYNARRWRRRIVDLAKQA